MQKLEGKTFNVVQDNIEKLKELFPEVLTEEKIDIDKLRLVLGENIEKEKERYEFSWNGKTEAIQLAQRQTTGTLRPCKEESVDWDNTKNLYIEGDNLEVMRILQNPYRNKIKMIYIDPPYNTGNDFIYKDNFQDNMKSYKEKINENMKTNAESNGRFHTEWLNMIYPRLKVARNLLHDDGVIFISIDDGEFAQLKKICDEIFGSTNFRNTILTRRRTKSLNSQFAENGLYSMNVGFEYILVYAKSSNFLMKALQMNKVNASKKGRWDVFWSNADRPTMRYDILGFTPSTGQWRNSKEKADLAVENYKVYIEKFSNELTLEEYYKKTGIKNFIRRIPNGIGKNGGVQHWVAPSDTALRTSNWTDIEVSQIGKEINLPFDNPKSKQLIMELMKLSNLQEGDIVLDFFSGSATTAHATMQLNAERDNNIQYIMIQLPELTNEKSEAFEAGYKNICEIGKERIRRAGKKIFNEYKINETGKDFDIGFKVFKLDETNLKLWDEESTDVESTLLDIVEPIKEERTQFDVVYEILLKYGIDLTVPMEQLIIANKLVYSVGMGYLLICLERDLSIEQVEEMAKQQPGRIVFYDEGFKDDTVRTNAQQILKRYGVEDIRVI